ncbi:MAG: hypothetical protein WEB58_20610 [Planctomycetaceae bacterium]
MMKQLWKPTALVVVLFSLAFAAIFAPTRGVTAPSAAPGEAVPAGELNEPPGDGPATLEPAYVVCFEIDDEQAIAESCPGLEFSDTQSLRGHAFDNRPFYVETDRHHQRLIASGTVTRLNDEKYRMKLDFFTGKFSDDHQRFRESHKISTSLRLKLNERVQFGTGGGDTQKEGETAIYRERSNYSVWIEKYDPVEIEKRQQPRKRIRHRNA